MKTKLFIIITVVLGFWIAQAKGVTEGLISHWKFDETSGVMAYDSAGTNHGIVHGAIWTSGQINSALDFDGVADYVALPDNEPIWLPQCNFTLSAWVYFDNPPGNSRESILDLNFGDSSIPSNELGCLLERRYASGIVRFSMTTTSDTDEDLNSNIGLTENSWFHVVAVRDGTTQAIYINGDLDNDRTCSSDPIRYTGGYDDDTVNIGSMSRSGFPLNWHVNGKIDDVRIHDRALSPEEVQQLYQDGLGSMDITPYGDFIPSGDKGGPFTPSSIDYQLTNICPNSISWQVAKTADWFDISSGSGTLDPNESTTITVTLNSTVQTLARGIYTDTLLFNDITNGREYGRRVILDVYGVISHWKFDETSGYMAYDSARANHGTVHGAVWTTGQINGALDFDGADDYVALPNNGPIWLPQYNFTLSAWVYFENPPGYSHESILDLNFADSFSPSNELGCLLERRGASGIVRFAMTTTSNTDEDLNSNIALNENAWFHIVAVRDGTTQAIYINGDLDNDRTCTSKPIKYTGGYDDDKVNIGRFSRSGSSPNYHFSGKIDDVRIDDRALSPEEVQQLYQAGLGSMEITPYGDFIPSGDKGGPFTPSSIDYRLTNICPYSIFWQVAKTADWLDISSGSGTLGPNESTTITVNLNSTAQTLAQGIHADTLLFNDITNGREYGRRVTLAICRTLYVNRICGNDSWTGFEPNCLSPNGPKRTIQAAIDAATDGDIVIVAEGTYSGTGNRDIDFSGKAITLRSIDPNDPEVVASTIINCNGTKAEPHRGFYFHSREDTNTIVAGFTITNGYGHNEPHRKQPTPRCAGGGIFCDNNSSPYITNCIISGNYGGGGGIACWHGSEPVITKCFITNNRSGDYGGGIICSESSPTISQCVISGNHAVSEAGGFWIFWYSNPKITNCTIVGNSASTGGGIFDEHYSSPVIKNCIIWHNKAIYSDQHITYDKHQGYGPIATYNDIKGGWIFPRLPGDGYNIDADPCFVYCYDWADITIREGTSNTLKVADAWWYEVNDIIEYSDDGVARRVTEVDTVNNIVTFTPALSGNSITNAFTMIYFWGPGVNDVNEDYHLTLDSPCIDAGDPNFVPTPGETDIDGEPRLWDGRIDMGADEYVPSLQVPMKFTPQTLNTFSQGKWVKAHFVFPENVTLDDVDCDNPAVLEPLGIESNYMDAFINEDDLVELEIAFDRAAVCDELEEPGPFQVTVIARFTNGQYFYGTDTITIINNHLEALAILSANWMSANCRKPHWCEGADLNQDSVVNLFDFAAINGSATGATP